LKNEKGCPTLKVINLELNKCIYADVYARM